MRRLMLFFTPLIILTFVLSGCTGGITTPRYSPPAESDALSAGERAKAEWTEGGALGGRVTDAAAGHALEGATVSIREIDLSAHTDQEGLYTLVNIPQGIHTVTVSHEGYRSLEERTIVVRTQVTTEHYELHETGENSPGGDPPADTDNNGNGGTVTGRVSDARTGRPLPEAELQVEGTALSTVTDRWGRYSLKNVPAALRANITASYAGYREGNSTVTVRDGRTSLANFSLSPLASNTPAPTPAPSPTQNPQPAQTATPSPSTNNIPIDLLTRYGWGHNNVIRWKDGVVDVYDTTNDPSINVGAILTTWNGTINGSTTFRLSRNTQSPITIYYDAAKVTSYGSGTWGVTTVWWRNYELVKAEVAILPCGTWYGNRRLCPAYELYKHELGHVVGFGGHTNDGGVMDAVANGSRTVTPTVRNMLQALYRLPIGYAYVPTRAPTVPPDGMAVIPLRIE